MESIEETTEIDYGYSSMMDKTVRVFLTNGSVVTGELRFTYEDSTILTDAAVRCQLGLYTCSQIMIMDKDVAAIGLVGQETAL